MQRIRIEFVSSGFRELLCSQPVADLVGQAASEVASAATSSATRSERSKNDREPALFTVKGPKLGGYGGGRYIAYVAADNGAAYRDAVYNYRLEKIIWELNR